MNKPSYTLTQDAIYASAINALIGATFEPDRMAQWQKQASFALSMLMPEQITGNTDKCRLLFIHLTAWALNLIDIESRALQLIREDSDLFSAMRSYDFEIELNEKSLKILTARIVAYASAAGVQSLEAGFAELEAAQQELHYNGNFRRN